MRSPSVAQESSSHPRGQGTAVDLYGPGLEEPFALVKEGIVRTGIVQGLLFVVMGLSTAIGGAVYGYSPVLAIGILGFVLSLFPFSGAVRIHRRLKAPRVASDGIYLPLPRRFLEGGYRLPAEAIATADLHESPPETFVSFEVNTAQGMRTVAIEKGLIVSWPAFVRALHRLGIKGVRAPHPPQPRSTVEEIFNRSGRRRLTYLGFVGGLAYSIVAGFSLRVSFTLLAFTFSSLVSALVIALALLSARRVPLHVQVDGHQVSIRLFGRSKPVRLEVPQIRVGAAWVTRLSGGSQVTYGPLDSEIVHLLESVARQEGDS